MRSSADRPGGVRGRRAGGPHRLILAATATALITLTGALAGCSGGAAAVAGGGNGSAQGSAASGATSPSTRSATSAVPLGASTASAAAVPMPTGDIPGWHQIFADDFPTDVPVGGFSGCDQGTVRACSGLPSAVEAKWWAYPDGWKDTSGQGVYMPSQTMSIADGMMHLHMYTAGGTASSGLANSPGCCHRSTNTMMAGHE